MSAVVYGGRRAPGAPYTTPYYGEILYVTYVGDVPCSVVTTKSTYDFNESRGDTIFHSSGSGYSNRGGQMLPMWVEPSGTSWWAADRVRLTIWDDSAKDTRDATPSEIVACGSNRLTDLPSDPFEDAREAEGGICYCTICEDHYDRDHTCHHLFKDDDGLTGPGDSESAGAPGDDCKASFLALCRRAGIVRRLAAGLVPFTWDHEEMHAVGGLGPSYVWFKSAGKRLGNIASKLDQYDGGKLSLQSGAGWIMSLDGKTTAANEKTKRWLDEEIAAQNARRASVAPVYVVTDSYRYVTDEARADTSYAGQHWTSSRYDARKEALRMSWLEAMSVAKALRKGGSREITIVHVRTSARKRKGAA